MTFIVLATVVAKPGRAAEVKADLLKIFEHVKNNEPDTLFYQLSVDEKDEHHFKLWEEYKDDAAFAFHTAQEPFIAFKNKAQDYTDVLDIPRYIPLATAK